MTSAEAKTVTSGFLSQVRGLFPGLEKLPSVLEEIERRETSLAHQEQERAALTAELATLSVQVRDLRHEQETVTATVAAKIAVEEQRQRAELEQRLAGLRQEIATGEARLREVQRS